MSSTSPPILRPGYTWAGVTDKIASIVLSRRTPGAWMVAFGVGLAQLAGDVRRTATGGRA